MRRTAITALVSLLTLAGQAQAACDGQWDIGGSWTLIQDNGVSMGMEITQAGRQLTGGAAGSAAGPLAGTVIGSAISFTVYFDNGTARYIAAIADDGGIAGTTFDPNNPAAKALWSTDQVATCVAAISGPQNAPPPMPGAPDPTPAIATTPQPPAPDTPRLVTVISDVDLYDVPGGVGMVIGILRRGESVPLSQCRDDMWCKIDRGWVWGEFLGR